MILTPAASDRLDAISLGLLILLLASTGLWACWNGFEGAARPPRLLLFRLPGSR